MRGLTVADAGIIPVIKENCLNISWKIFSELITWAINILTTWGYFPINFQKERLVHSVGTYLLMQIHILSMCNFFFEKSADWPKPVTRKIGQKNHKETDTTHIGETLATNLSLPHDVQWA